MSRPDTGNTDTGNTTPTELTIFQKKYTSQLKTLGGIAAKILINHHSTLNQDLMRIDWTPEHFMQATIPAYIFALRAGDGKIYPGMIVPLFTKVVGDLMRSAAETKRIVLLNYSYETIAAVAVAAYWGDDKPIAQMAIRAILIGENIIE